MLTTYHQTKLALGCNVTLVIIDESPSQRINEIFEKLWQAVFIFESRFSRFLPRSELSLFNKNAGQTTTISAEFKKLLEATKAISIETGGLFNPFVLPILHKIGYQQSFVKKYANDTQEDYSKRQYATIVNLIINNNEATIPWGTAIDFGGIGKGYLADQLAILMPKDVVGYWFSIGGDFTTFGTDENGHNWQVRIEDSRNTGTVLKKWIVDALPNKYGIATSSILERKGSGWHHIIDTRDQRPASSDVAVATVCCGSAAKADVLAKLAIVLGSSAESIDKLLAFGAESILMQCHTNNKVYIKHFGNNIIRKAI